MIENMDPKVSKHPRLSIHLNSTILFVCLLLIKLNLFYLPILQSSVSVSANIRSSYQTNCLVRDLSPPPHVFEQSVQDDQSNHDPQAETGQDTHSTAGSLEQRSAERLLTLSDVQTQSSDGSSSSAISSFSIELNDSLI